MGLPTEDGVSDRTVQVHSGQHVDEFTEVCETMLPMSRREFLLSVDNIWTSSALHSRVFRIVAKKWAKRDVSV